MDVNLSVENENIPEINGSIVYELGIETTKLLNKEQDELSKIQWTNGEANIDVGFSELSCKLCKYAWDNKIKVKYPQFTRINITCNIPDIIITFTYPDGTTRFFKIELKSTKGDILPGGTILKLDINQTLIICKRPSKKSKIYKLKCSQYHAAMGKSNMDLFQDRSPRPSISFKKLNEIDNPDPYIIKENDNIKIWSEHYANCAINRVNSNGKSWQDVMVKKIIDNTISEYIKNTSDEQFKIDKISLLLDNSNIN